MSLYSIWPILSPPHSFNMKEQILNTAPVQGHCSISPCIANPLPAAHRCRLLWRGAAPLTQALCPAESSKLTVQSHDPQVHTPESPYWTERSRLLLLPSSRMTTPAKVPVLLCSFQWTEEMLWVPPQRLPHTPEGPGRGGMLDFLSKTTKLVYTIHIQTQGHPWHFFFSFHKNKFLKTFSLFHMLRCPLWFLLTNMGFPASIQNLLLDAQDLVD